MLKILSKMLSVRKFNYFRIEKYALTEKYEQLFIDIQPLEELR